MTITLHWYHLPILFVVIGMIIGSISTRDYDFVTPVLAFCCFVIAGAITIGHFL